MPDLSSIIGRLAGILALLTAMAGAAFGGVLLHDWLIGMPSQQLAEVEPATTDYGAEVAAVAGPVETPVVAPTAAPPVSEIAPATSQAAAETPVLAAPSPVQPPAEPLSSRVADPMESAAVAAPMPTAAVPTAEVEPVTTAAVSATWLRYAVPIAVPAGQAMIAVVIDDVGVNTPRNTDRVVALPGPLTLALMSYAPDVTELAAAARAAGHELLVHVPMEPEDGGLSTGPNALRADLPADEMRQRLRWALTRFDGYVGINNHMGSQFTAFEAGMTLVLEELRGRGLLFLDSKTTAASVGAAVADRLGVPFAERDVFLDNETSAGAVGDQLNHLEQVARRKGYAIAIGHPHDGTIEALAAWLPTVEQRGFVLVPVSRIVQRNLLKAAATN